MQKALGVLVGLSLAGCGNATNASTDSGPVDAGTTDAPGHEADSGSDGALPDSDAGYPTVGGDRPARVVLPSDYDGSTALPLVILLHGYSATAAMQDEYFGLSAAVDDLQFLLVLPNGMTDGSGKPFWNATPACCDFGDTGVDDVTYLHNVLLEMKANYNVDATRVFFVGHSNGGFMAYRMACEIADEITGIVSLAGATYLDESNCDAARPVHVLHIHGTSDLLDPYAGTFRWPGAETTVERWATRAGCSDTATELGTVDIDTTLSGEETHELRYDQGCTTDVDVELWKIQGGDHVPNLGDNFASLILGWAFSHTL